MREDGIDQKFEEKGNMIRQLSEEEREKGNKEVSKFIQKHAQRGFIYILMQRLLIILTTPIKFICSDTNENENEFSYLRIPDVSVL